MHKTLKIAAILLFATTITTGCRNLATANVSPSTDLSALKTMHVKHFPSDNSGVNQEIADKLRSKGVAVTTGSGTPPSTIDALVTYVDKWRWDITMYMLELTVTIRDPKTEATLATGRSLHTSLTRKSQTEMVDEVINNIYSSAPLVTQNSQAAPASKPTLAVTPVTVNSAAVPTNKDLAEKLQVLNDLKKDRLITEDEYANKRKQLIESF